MNTKEEKLLKALGDKIREIRIAELLVSQEVMAANCGITQHQLSLIERGMVESRILTLRKISGGSYLSLSKLLDIDLHRFDNKYFPEGEMF